METRATTDSAQKCADMIKASGCVSALTGAGISTKAGIPDFRGPQGIYVTGRYDADIIFDIHYFLNDPKPFYDFARDFIQLEKTVKPTLTHNFLAQLESINKLQGIITQNIDCLHQKAGSKNVLEMHGSIWRSYCLECEKEYPYHIMCEKVFAEDVPQCECGGVIKPDVVFFGENVKYFAESAALAEKSDLFFVIGSSCVIFPAAAIPNYVSGDVVVVNQDKVVLPNANVILEISDDIDTFFQQVTKYF